MIEHQGGLSTIEILDELTTLRKRDAPTHGGRVLSYVYDSGLAELDELAGKAAELVRPLNGLDPTAFPSIAVMESELVAFVRHAVNGDTAGSHTPVVGSVTSGGTESCLLAVKTARDLWRTRNPKLAGRLGRAGQRPRLVLPATAHAAFHKASRLFDLELDVVPCKRDGTVSGAEVTARLSADVALVVVSAPAYPTGMIDPVSEVSQAAAAHGIACHVDACFGGLALPWWPGTSAWDFRNPGVTSVSADLHKFGYAPKGVSVLLHRGRDRHRAQFFAFSGWPGYPVVNPTLLGSRSVSSLAAAWAIIKRLGDAGYADLTASCVRSVRAITDAVDGIEGLRVWGNPTGPALAVVSDETVPPPRRVDPHHLADDMARRGILIQHQPGRRQPNGERLPHSAHLTVTPVTESLLDELIEALRESARVVRGRPRPRVGWQRAALRGLGYGGTRVPGPEAAWRILRIAGAAKLTTDDRLAPGMAGLMALVEELPEPVAEALVTELLARVTETFG